MGEPEPELAAGEEEKKKHRRGILICTAVCFGLLVNYVLLFPFPVMWYFDSEFYDTSPIWMDNIVEWMIVPLEVMSGFEPYGTYLEWAYELVERLTD